MPIIHIYNKLWQCRNSEYWRLEDTPRNTSPPAEVYFRPEY